ncbi:CCN family member 1-like [Genypterus blacodes]|uniref:CCN family member 1-like n=1 Tax=Genypterus blacodes TaxID=154954 RepID=UPI003F770CA8
MWTILSVAILCGTLILVSASCPKDCRCAPDIPTCVPGVSLVMDRCGCCEVCAKQLNDDCSETEPCDHVTGLECNYGGGYHSTKGICRAKSEGRSCEYNNKIYQNGESFRPNCKHQCTCLDGAVGCVSLCPHKLAVPGVDCAKPRLVKVPGSCCGRLVCPEEAEAKSFMKEHHSKTHKRGRQSEDDLTRENELAPAWSQRMKLLPAFANDQVSHLMASGDMCLPQTTDWSPCSKSCGAGVSTRMTNSNIHCNLEKESRICEVRPCGKIDSARLRNGQKCKHTEKARRPLKLSYAGCSSLKKFRPKYCGSCADGRCCSPHRTQTLPVRFRCKDGETLSRKVMMIQSCKCDFNCSHYKSAPLWNDI